MSYQSARKNPVRFRALTGMTEESFNTLLPYFHDAHDEYFKYHLLNGKPRTGIRPPVIYKSSPLPSVVDRLYFILYYLKNNVTQELLADHFGMEQPKCCQWIHCLHGILVEALRQSGFMPATNAAELQKLYDTMDSDTLSVLLHDGTEREIPRPTDADSQKNNYSGKKKRHTVKNAVISSVLGAILFVSQTVCGKTHDKRMADDNYWLPETSYVLQDTGYQGYRPGNNTFMPIKKKKGRGLLPHEREFNQRISSHRVKVEHHIGSAKILHVVRFECRLRKNNFIGNVFHTAAAIHNLRLGVKIPI